MRGPRGSSLPIERGHGAGLILVSAVVVASLLTGCRSAQVATLQLTYCYEPAVRDAYANVAGVCEQGYRQISEQEYLRVKDSQSTAPAAGTVYCYDPKMPFAYERVGQCSGSDQRITAVEYRRLKPEAERQYAAKLGLTFGGAKPSGTTAGAASAPVSQPASRHGDTGRSGTLSTIYCADPVMKAFYPFNTSAGRCPPGDRELSPAEYARLKAERDRQRTEAVAPRAPERAATPVPSKPKAPATKPQPEPPKPVQPQAAPPSAKTPQVVTSGTGFLVNSTGYLLTNEHVVASCGEVWIRSIADVPSKAAVVARDKQNDLALLKASATPAPSAVFRSGASIRPGDDVVTFGFPYAGALSSGGNVTTGNVAALSGLRNDTRRLQITAPIQPGNSGGPLLDLAGNVVGVIVSQVDALRVAVTTGDIPQNVNFAIKATLATSFLEAHGIRYQTAESSREKRAADVGEVARGFTVLVACLK